MFRPWFRRWWDGCRNLNVRSNFENGNVKCSMYKEYTQCRTHESFEVLYSRVEWFWREKKCYTFYVVPNCCWTPNPKCHVLMLPLSLVAGPQKMWTVTLKSEEKKEEEKSLSSLRYSKKYLFCPCTDQKRFAIFRKIKNNN